jgi:hypothetical protein
MRVLVIAFLAVQLWFAAQQQGLAQTRDFTVPDHGVVSFASSGAPSLTVGYARIQAQNRLGEYGLPGGMAIYSLRQNGVLVSEVSVPAAPLIPSGRIYAEIAGPVNTAVAIANPNAQPVMIDFYFTDENGNDFGQGSTTIAANHQIAVFLNESPFNAVGSIRGTFTFTSSLLVSAIGLRCFTNERNEFLMTTLPVAPLASLFPSRLTIPHFADGGGWQTSVVLVNPADTTITGELRPYAQSGQPLTLTLNGQTSDVFVYSVPPRSSATFQGSGAQPNVQVGSITVNPSSTTNRPSVFVIFRYSVDGVSVTESSVQADGSGGTVLSMFVESFGNLGAPGSILSGIAVTNSGVAQPTYIHFELFQSDGTMIGRSAEISIPEHWQASMFLNEIPGLPPIPSSFQGVLRIVATAMRFATPYISVTGLRCRHNERGDFLITTTSPISEVYFTPSPELLFPQFAIGGGYDTQFVLFSDNGSTGTVYFFDQSGNPLPLSLQ